MKNYTYNSVEKSTTIIVQVSDEWHEILEQMDKDEARNERRETRRHMPIDYLHEIGMSPDGVDFDFAKFEAEENKRKAENKALTDLTPTQKEIYNLHYVQGIDVCAIAELRGIHHSAVSRHLDAIRKKLKKF